MANQTPGDRVLAVRRTLVPLAWAWLIGALVELGVDVSWLTDRPHLLMAAQLILAALIYLAAVVLGRRWPWIERAVLSSTSQPHYDKQA